MLLLVSAAGASPLADPPNSQVSASTIHWDRVHPILAARCFECHAGEQRKGGFSLGTRDGLMRGGASGAAVVEGDAATSHLIELVTSDDPFEQMPPEGPRLTEDEVDSLRRWIDAGAPWGVTGLEDSMYLAALALHPVDRPEGAENPIDAHLQAELAEIEAGPALTDTEFARRIHLDLIGLLPTPDQLRRFLADESPDKRTELIDALLADDLGRAEHWMSFWNDLLRNDFQGTGYIDGGRLQITGWLFDALLHNQPYDAFVRELVAPTVDGSRGFIQGIVWRGDNAVVQQAPMQAAIHVSQVFLGINLKCAACHDSFVNDWSLAQTFALANCFSDEPLSLTRCDTDLGVPAEYGFLWPSLGEVDGAAPREERMAQIASFVTSTDNGYFARTIVNRLWALFMGRGLVEPLDEIERRPWHPELLDDLSAAFIESGYDLRWLMRTIVTSRAYQSPSVEAASSNEFAFEGPGVRRLTAEEFYDAVGNLTGVWQVNPRFDLPEGAASEPRVRAWRVPLDPLSRALGRTAREQVTTRRETAGTTMQALELANGGTLDAHLRRSAETLRAGWAGSATELIDELFLRALQRKPTPAEQQVALELLVGESPDDGKEASVSQEGLEDLLWSLCMLPEFQLIR
ncbi:Planctomycete cytochrome C [Planctomycetes bacterium Poly30]|uniref:Planctomycete cytochrome C n=1 Tax=Saltatorellus ferox TaxID=2528018 RepID=A0A518EL34_9BACT|nr:Planctomycete cytochrome C [Planctomycetes bacterium Poly30]